MIDEIVNLLRANTFLFGGITGLLGAIGGAYFGHRLALGRDRRNDRNRAIAPVRAKLVTLRSDLSTDRARHASDAELDAIAQQLRRRALTRFRRACDEYKRHRDDMSPHPAAPLLQVFSDPAATLASVDALLIELTDH